VRAPTGAQPLAVRTFGDRSTGSRVITGDHRIAVPLDGADPGRGSIEVYARELRNAERVEADLPYLLFLQGGPGGRAPRPGVDGPGWLRWALERYRVLLLDQRGTGRSTPLDRHTLAALGRPRRQTDHLALHRADRIVDDAEALRRHLLGDLPWSVLGQSYGGFCVWTYLGRAPHGLTAGYVTGGVPPLGAPPEDVYRATHRALDRRIADLDAAHPRVREVLSDVAYHLERVEERLPTGERLTPARLQSIGIVLGGAGGIDALAHLVDDAWALPGRRLSDTFLAGVAGIVSFAANPLYALLHEAIYAEDGMVTRWAAQRVRDELALPDHAVRDPDGAQRLPLTGEMIYPSAVGADPALAPLAETAELLAQRVWTEPLYDRRRLAANTVPVAARVYTQDMFVDPDLSRRTAARTGAVRVVEDDVHHHDGLRRAGEEILAELHDALGAAATGAGAAPGPEAGRRTATGSGPASALEAAS
jgi:pimeloyl-ACP methyl ester carboxylesterase